LPKNLRNKLLKNHPFNLLTPNAPQGYRFATEKDKLGADDMFWRSDLEMFSAGFYSNHFGKFYSMNYPQYYSFGKYYWGYLKKL
jgi:hypothetical protein